MQGSCCARPSRSEMSCVGVWVCLQHSRVSRMNFMPAVKGCRVSGFPGFCIMYFTLPMGLRILVLIVSVLIVQGGRSELGVTFRAFCRTREWCAKCDGPTFQQHILRQPSRLLSLHDPQQVYRWLCVNSVGGRNGPRSQQVPTEFSARVVLQCRSTSHLVTGWGVRFTTTSPIPEPHPYLMACVESVALIDLCPHMFDCCDGLSTHHQGIGLHRRYPHNIILLIGSLSPARRLVVSLVFSGMT